MEIPNKTETVTVKVEPEVKAILQRAALHERQRLSTWLRDVGLRRAHAVLRRQDEQS